MATNIEEYGNGYGTGDLVTTSMDVKSMQVCVCNGLPFYGLTGLLAQKNSSQRRYAWSSCCLSTYSAFEISGEGMLSNN